MFESTTAATVASGGSAIATDRPAAAAAGSDTGAETLVALECTVNGEPVATTVPCRMSLADFLRDRLRLTGTHVGCEHGVCGACTVLVDGRSVRSCLMFAVQAGHAEITTVEGLTAGGRNADLCAAMSARHGLQCGFCTPGFLASAAELLAEASSPDGPRAPLDEATVRESLSGNVCRCTGYAGIVRAVLDTAASRRGQAATG